MKTSASAKNCSCLRTYRQPTPDRVRNGGADALTLTPAHFGEPLVLLLVGTVEARRDELGRRDLVLHDAQILAHNTQLLRKFAQHL
jgi:hypothetical protein